MNLAFGKRPVLTAYDVKRPTQPFDARNTEASPLAALSDRQDLTHEDRIDENAFNAAIWQSAKGAGTPVPAAQHRVMGGGVAGE